MRNRAACELTERHQSLVTRTETLINELHSAGPAQTGQHRRDGSHWAPKSLFFTEGNPLKTLPWLNGVDLLWICSLSKHSPVISLLYSPERTCWHYVWFPRCSDVSKKKHWTHFNNHCFHQNFMFFSFETQTHDLERHTHDTKLCITTYAEKISHLIGWWEKMFNNLDNLLTHARHSGGVRHSCNPNWQFNSNAQYSADSATRGLSIRTKQKVFLRWLRLR